MIVQCPKCKTKFGVSDAQLAGLTSPQFHCSRCDNTFFESVGLEHVCAADFGNSKVASRSISAVCASEGVPVSVEKCGSKWQQLDMFAPEASAESKCYESPIKTFGDMLDSGPSALITADWPTDDTQKIEIDMSSVLRKRLNEDAISNGVLRFRKEALERLHDLNQADRRVDWPQAYSPSDFFTKTNSPYVDLPDCCRSDIAAIDKAAGDVVSSLETISSPSKLASLEKEFKSNSSESYELVMPASHSETHVEERGPIQVFSDFDSFDSFDMSEQDEPDLSPQPIASEEKEVLSNRPLYFACFFPLLVCILLGVAGLLISRVDALATVLLSLDSDSVSSQPPAGLELAKLRSTVATLDDGQQVLNIRGEVVNNTNRPMSEIKIEAKLFDGNNQPLEKTLVAAQGDIVNALEIGSLKDSAVSSVAPEDGEQSLESSNVLKPGSSMSFRLVLADSVQNAEWYAVRVHSVKYVLGDAKLNSY